jgi:hypothetical protein
MSEVLSPRSRKGERTRWDLKLPLFPEVRAEAKET